MTQSFDEWFEKNGELYREPTSEERYLFEAGAASRQAEIDELQEKYRIKSEFLNDADAMIKYQDSVINELKSKLETAENNLNNAFKTIKFEQQYQDELQKRIDDALKVLNDATLTMLDKKAIKILKGETE